MAKSEGKNEKKGGGGLIGMIVVTIIAVGFGAGFGFFLDGQMKGEAKAEAPKEEPVVAQPEKSNVPNTAKLIAMAPIVANLAEPSDVWIRIEASMLIDGLQEGGDALAAQVAEDFVAYLKTTPLAQFEGASGFQNLREDFLDRATIRDSAHIKDVIIHGVVLE